MLFSLLVFYVLRRGTSWLRSTRDLTVVGKRNSGQTQATTIMVIRSEDVDYSSGKDEVIVQIVYGICYIHVSTYYIQLIYVLIVQSVQEKKELLICLYF